LISGKLDFSFTLSYTFVFLCKMLQVDVSSIQDVSKSLIYPLFLYLSFKFHLLVHFVPLSIYLFPFSIFSIYFLLYYCTSFSNFTLFLSLPSLSLYSHSLLIYLSFKLHLLIHTLFLFLPMHLNLFPFSFLSL